jgi:A/G-specific adenine glycosylase
LKNTNFTDKIIAWYKHHKRDLPWRHTQDPYLIWLSEVILQQTRVAQGQPYYERFAAAYPTVSDLAAAPEQEVLRLWQGLGYYSRARNLHQMAKHIVENLDGQFPKTYHELLKLKGVGSYTAAAIASFAYNESVAVLDGNVYRVLARFFGIKTDISSHRAKKEFEDLAQELIPMHQPAVFNQAMMEFGALQCQPLSPDCLLCPLQNSCVAQASGEVALLPIKTKKIKQKERYLNYLVLVNNDKIALNERAGRDIWQGLFEFDLIETSTLINDFEDLLLPPKLVNRLNQAIIEPPTKTYTHLLTHQRLIAQFWIVRLADEIPSTSFYDVAAIEKLPKPNLITNFLKEYFFL